MARKPKNMRTFSFATPHKRAKAIEFVAEQHPKLKVSRTIMKTPDEAEAASLEAFQRIETKGAGGYNRNLDPIAERYRGLGKQGIATLVRIEAPAGEVDFLELHQQVDALLGPKDAAVKVL
jgi:hypothetical protein